MYYRKIILFFSGLFILCLCEITQDKRNNLLSDFINYYNLQPNRPNKASEGYLRSIEQTDPNTYKIDISFKVQNDGPKLMHCTATIQEIGDMGIAIVNYDMHCEELQKQVSEEPDEAKETSIEADLHDSGPVKLENEVQVDTGITSGEQFIAIPRSQPSAPCIGCSSYVNPQAEGVNVLANLGVRHLDLHDPSMKHSLDSVITVERQVQVVNGVRYILTLLINFSNCTEIVCDACNFVNTCKVAILVKPWQILPSGSKYRAILSNNCTEKWQFGDNGEVLPEHFDKNGTSGQSTSDAEQETVHFEHREGVNSQPNQEKTLSIDEIRALEEQIISDDHAESYFHQNEAKNSIPPNRNKENKNTFVPSESTQQYNEDFISVTESGKHETSTLSVDKKKVIDEMLDFLNFAGLKPKADVGETITREKRSYDYDLQVLSLTENYKAIKKSIENAKYVYKMAQKMIDYLNEMDMVIKNRAIKNVIKAEEEEDNDKRFLYIQAQVTIPCDTASCEYKEDESRICNGVVDDSDKSDPQVMNSFCYRDPKNIELYHKVKEVPLYDPVLLRLTKIVLRTMENESNKTNALKIKKILSANTYLGSGRTTTISMILEHLNCNKSIPVILRTNCSTTEYPGSIICEVVVHEKYLLKEKKITYSCNERTADMTISKFKKNSDEVPGDDPKIIEMLQEALQYLETNSNRPNKQKITNVKSISTDFIAGFLVKIKFIVGYTNCMLADYQIQTSNCTLLKNEPLRSCTANIWDRSWIVDGRQLEVLCDEESDAITGGENSRRKRSARYFRKHDQNINKHILGGQTQQDPDNPKFRTLATESMQKYLAINGILEPHRVVRVDKATVQVVAGFLTRIDFVASPIKKTNGDVLNCHSEVWERAWLKKKDISVTCDAVNQRVKRGIPGGSIDKDPTDPKYVELANESMQKYLTSNGNSQPYRVARINKVTTQVVTGSLTRLDFVVSPVGTTDGDVLNCHSKVWERPWLNEKDISVTCDVVNQRVKRGIPGGSIDKDPTDPKYVELANESMQKYLTSNGNSQPYRVARINKVTTQVVAGSLTRLDFVVSPVGTTDGDVLNCHSKVWERPWLNEKDISVTCDVVNQRVKRGIPGGSINKDPTDPKYVELANESMQKYLTSNGNSQPHSVVKIKKVTTQVVAGSLTRLDFEVSPVGTTDGDVLNCHSKVWERPWLNEKDISVTCDCVNQRVKRGIPGGSIDKDPTDPKYVELANESMQKYLTSNGNSQPYRVARINKVTTQVVAGSLTRLDFVVSPVGTTDGDVLNCHSKVWERPWLNEKDISVTCDVVNQRVKRGIPGGSINKDPTDPKYVELANESMQKYLTSNGNSQPHSVVKIKKVTTQVVAGSLTRLDFEVSPVGTTDGDVLNCHSKVWERPWLNEKDISVTCDCVNQRVKRGIPGGSIDKDPTDPKYVELANESMQKYLTSNGNSQPYRVARINKVTTQVVAGSLTRLDFVVSPVGTTDGDVLNCHSKVWERPWLHEKDISVTCDVVNQRVKRGIPGGSINKDPTDPKYVELANESMQKYLTSNGNSQPYRVARINKVTTQVVAGSLTRLDFVVSPVGTTDGDVLNCHSKVWERPWLNEKDISVTCDVVNQRVKRGIPGGSINKDPTDPKYVELANESMQKYLTSNGNSQPHSVVKIKKVTTQVVAGSLTRLDFEVSPVGTTDGDVLNCHSKVWERPWLNEKDISVTCDCVNQRVKRRIIGDFTMKSGEDAKLRAKNLFSSDNNIYPYHSKHIDITKQKFQIMANDTQYEDVLESEDENGDSLSGPASFDDQRAQKMQESNIDRLAEEALEQYLSYMDVEYIFRITQIHNSYEHIDNGIINKIEFSIAPTICLRHEYSSSWNNCDFKIPKIEYRCNANIYDRPWLRNKKEINITCENSLKPKTVRFKRQLDVEQIVQEDNEIDEDATYFYADRAVQHLNDAANTNNLYKLITVHAMQTSMQMKAMVVKMYVEVAETYCLRHQRDIDLNSCDEMEGLNHRLCFARIYPSPDDEMTIRHIAVVCDDNDNEFESVTGLNIAELVRLSITVLESRAENRFKLVHQGEPLVIPSLETTKPIKLNFIVATTNCTKDVILDKNPFQCYLDATIPAKSCISFIWLETQTKTIHNIDVACQPDSSRVKRSLLDTFNTKNNSDINNLIIAALEKIEMSSLHRYKLRVLHVNSYSTKITSGITTTIDFDIGYTSCLKYEWVENISSCDFLEHLPRRHCVARILERLWIKNGKNIEVSCEDDETPLEAHIEFESADLAMQLAQDSLKHIEAKYPHPRKQKVVRIFSLDKQAVAGIHYRMKIEVGLTNCTALSEEINCKLVKDAMNKFCRVNVWVRPWTDNPPNFRVICDFQEGNSGDIYHQIQAEDLFYNFLATYNPNYVNDHSELEKRFEIFQNNVRKMHELNVHEKGTAIYGVTRFADLTYQEFRSRYMGLKISLRNKNMPLMKTADIPNVILPQAFDWRSYDTVTEVKDQISCANSWAFSVVGNIEGQWKIHSGKLVMLSEQVLLDCDKLNEGCDGGLPENAYRTIEELGGLQLENDYPYEGERDKCLFNKTLAVAQITGVVNITTNETGMAQWLLKNGPISVGINGRAMQFYQSGVAHPWKTFCNSTDLDHSVLIVGFGVKEYPQYHTKLPYWIVKNSWGPYWGEQGYYRVYRGDGTCGINQMATSAVI